MICKCCPPWRKVPGGMAVVKMVAGVGRVMIGVMMGTVFNVCHWRRRWLDEGMRGEGRREGAGQKEQQKDERGKGTKGTACREGKMVKIGEEGGERGEGPRLRSERQSVR